MINPRFGALILLLAAMVHVDWHVGRGVHHGMSLGWPCHWIVGAVSLAVVAWLVLRWQHRLRTLLAVLVTGLAAGQIVEPWLETLLFRLSWSEVMPAERWRIFLEFTVAGVLGVLLVPATVHVARRVRYGARVPQGG